MVTHPYAVPENMPFSTKARLILLMPAFFLQKISIFQSFPCIWKSLWVLQKACIKIMTGAIYT